MSRVKDLTGFEFGRLTVLSYAGSDKKYNALWSCFCECGNTKVARADNLKSGRASSCGCLFLEIVETTAIRLQREANERGPALSDNRRRLIRENGFEKIDRDALYERDGGLCHICQTAVDPEDWHMDHIIPVTKGGGTFYSNVAVSHPVCNQKKGNR